MGNPRLQPVIRTGPAISRAYLHFWSAENRAKWSVRAGSQLSKSTIERDTKSGNRNRKRGRHCPSGVQRFMHMQMTLLRVGGERETGE